MCVMCFQYDNRLIVIIIKIIILYFIQIRHTDDFPSTGTRLVEYNLYYTYMPLFDVVDPKTLD